MRAESSVHHVVQMTGEIAIPLRSVRRVTTEEAEAGIFTIYDVVLPLPGTYVSTAITVTPAVSDIFPRHCILLCPSVHSFNADIFILLLLDRFLCGNVDVDSSAAMAAATMLVTLKGC